HSLGTPSAESYRLPVTTPNFGKYNRRSTSGVGAGFSRSRAAIAAGLHGHGADLSAAASGLKPAPTSSTDYWSQVQCSVRLANAVMYIARTLFGRHIHAPSIRLTV